MQSADNHYQGSVWVPLPEWPMERRDVGVTVSYVRQRSDFKGQLMGNGGTLYSFFHRYQHFVRLVMVTH